MKDKYIIAATFRQTFLWIFILLVGNLGAQPQRMQLSLPKMGSPFSITLFATDTSAARVAMNDAMLFADTLIGIFSDYEPNSEINMLASQPTNMLHPVSDHLLQLLLTSKKAWRQSKHRYDVGAGALTLLWRSAIRQNVMPASAEIAAAKAKSGIAFVKINRKQKRVAFKREGLTLNFGGIAKGYIAQQVVNRLAALGFTSVLVDAGGDMVAGAPPPGKDAWNIGVEMPGLQDEPIEQSMLISHLGVATSGSTYQFILHKGLRYSHILDPRTGYGVTHQRQITVLARSGELADWLATACSILSVQAALRLAKRNNAELAIGEWQQGKLGWHFTPGFPLRNH